MLGAGAAIAGGDVPGDLDRPRLARRQDAAGVGIDDADGHAGQRRALRDHAAVERPGAWRHRAVPVGLGRAVDVADIANAELLGGEAHFLRRADHQPGTQAPGALAAELGMAQRRAGHAGQRVDRGAALALDQIEPATRLEARLQHQRRAVAESRRQRVDRAIGPEQRRGQQHAVGLGERHALADGEAVGDDRAVNQPHRLGLCAGARGVEDQRVVIGICRVGGDGLGGGDELVVFRAEHHDGAQARVLGPERGERGGEILTAETLDRDERVEGCIPEQVFELALA